MLSVSKISSVGLCSTCNNSTSCVYRKKRGMDAIYCEMFDGYALPESRDNGDHDKETALPTTETTVQSNFKGLCINCDNRDFCTLPRPEGGVWHCEEYC